MITLLIKISRKIYQKGLLLLASLQKSVFKIIHLEVFIYKKNHHYVPNYYGRSAAKQIDIRTMQPFGELAKRTIEQGNCMLYYDRLYTIFQALSNVYQKIRIPNAMSSAEVGVYRGGTSHFIASVLKALGHSSVEHFCFDTFQGHAEQDINPAVEVRHRAGKFSATSYETVKQYLRVFDNVTIYKGRFQDTCNNINNTRFGFIHLDVDIYEPTMFALNYFDQRLVSGGIIIVDDYGFNTCPGIIKAVQEFSDNHDNYMIMRQLTGQCLLVKLQQ